MNANKKTTGLDMKVKLSTLWIVVMFNIVYADILSLFIPGVHEELAEFVGGTPITLVMLVGAITLQVPIAMIFFSRVLKYRANRWANIIAGAITIVLVIGGGSTNPHYIFIATIAVVSLLAIIWHAWKWPKQEARVDSIFYKKLLRC